jgi:hypothetical protein
MSGVARQARYQQVQSAGFAMRVACTIDYLAAQRFDIQRPPSSPTIWSCDVRRE